MRGALAFLFLACATPVVAQDGGGFFSNLFGGGDAEEEAEAEEDGGGYLERKLEELLSAEGTNVEITGFEGVLTGEARMERMTIADADGIWMTLDDVVLDWNRSALLRRRVEVEELSTARIVIERPPLPAETAPVPAAEAAGFSLPELPVAIEIGRLAAERVELGQPVIGVETAVSVEGSMSLADGEGVVDFDILRLDGEGELILDASYSNTSDILSVDLRLTEAEDGILAALIDLPGRPALDLTAQGEGPIDDFAAEIVLATDGEPRMTGQVTMAVQEDGARVTQVDLAGDLAPLFADEYAAFFGTDTRLSADIVTASDGLRVENLQIDAGAIRLDGDVILGPDGLPRVLDVSGAIATEDGAPVLLPLPGPETRVRQATIEVAFDAAESEDWQARVEILDLDRPGFSAAEVTLEGIGRISREPQGATAAFDFAATRLDLGNPDAKAALGEEVTGSAEIIWTKGEPLRIAALTLQGESYGIEGSATVATGENGPLIEGRAQVRADRLAAFSGLAGRTLGGAVELRTDFSTEPLGGFFDVTATGRTTDLVVSEPRADAILAGSVRLDLTAARDETGTRVEIRRLDSPNASLRGQATLKSEGSSLSLSGNVVDASIILPQVEGPLRITMEASEAQGQWTWRADAGLEGTELVASGTATGVLTSPVIAASGSLTAEDLSDFAAIAQRPLSGAIETTFAAEFATDRSRISLNLDGVTRDLVTGIERIDPLLTGEVVLDVDAAWAGGVVAFRDTRVEGDGVALTLNGVLTETAGSVDLTLALDDATKVLVGAPPGRIDADATLARDGRDWNFDVTATGPSFRLDTEGSVLDPLGAFSADGRLDARFDDLSDFSRLAGRELSGALDVEAEGRLSRDLSDFDLTAEGTARGVTLGLRQVDDILQGNVAFDLAAVRVNNSDISYDLTARGAEFSLSSEGVVTDPLSAPAWTGDLRLEADDLSIFSGAAGRPLSGAVDLVAEGSASSDLSALDLTASGRFQDVSVSDARIDPILQGEVAFDLTAERTGANAFAYRLEAQGAEFAIDSAGQVTDPFATPVWAGTLALEARDLDDFAALVGRDLSGRARIEVEGEVSADLSTLDLDASGSGRNIAIGDARVDPLLTGDVSFDIEARRDGEDGIAYVADIATGVLRLDSQGTIADPFGTIGWSGRLDGEVLDASALSGLAGRPLSGRITVEAEGTAISDLSQIDLQLSATATEFDPGVAGLGGLLAGETKIDLTARRAAGGALDYDLEAQGRGFGVDSAGRVTGLETTPVVEGQLAARLDDLSTLSGLAGRPLAGRLELDADGLLAVDLSRFDLRARANGAGLSVGIAAVDRLLGGEVIASLDAEKSGETIRIDDLLFRSASLTVTGRGTAGPGGESIEMTARLADISPFVPGLSGPATAEGSVTRRADGGFALDIDATGPGGITATVAGGAAADFSTLDLDITGDAPLALVNQFIEPRSLNGRARFDLRLDGPPAVTSLSGQITTADARLVAPSLGFVFENIDSTIDLVAGRANLNLTSSIANGGQVSMTGPLSLAPPFDADLTLTLRDAYFSNPRLYETTVSGPVTIRGPLAGGAFISGGLRLGETLVRIPSSPIGGAGAVPEIIHLNTTPPIRETLERARALDIDDDAPQGPTYGLDVTISAPNRVFVRGRGLDSEFGGTLRLTGTTRDIVPVGNFNLIRGRLDILGQRLAIEEATVTMQGSFVPVVRIRASTDTDEYRIDVIVSGRVDDPAIRFTSDPDLPEEEVLARLLFGRGLDTLSPLQAARLALAVRTLAGQGGEGLVGDIRDTAGLADFDVTQDDEGNLAVRAGAYLSENVYTDVTVGAAGETELNLNLDVSKSVTAKVSVSSEGETSVGIFYERDY